MTVAPVPTALMLFGTGALGIHHVHKMHRMAHEVDQDIAAKRILEDFEATIHTLPPERAWEVIKLLEAHYS